MKLGVPGWRAVRFAAVGLAAALAYAGLTLALTRHTPLGAVGASIVAYTIAAALSYCGHRRWTFRDQGAHARSAPRFAGVALIGYALSAAVPALLTGRLGLPLWQATAATCLLVPACTYLGLDRLVFPAARRACPR